MLLDFGELRGKGVMWGRRGDLPFSGICAVIEYQKRAVYFI